MAEVNLICCNCLHGPHQNKPCSADPFCKCQQFVRADIQTASALTMIYDLMQQQAVMVQGFAYTVLELLGEAFPEAKKVLQARRDEERAAQAEAEAANHREQLEKADEAYKSATGENLADISTPPSSE